MQARAIVLAGGENRALAIAALPDMESAGNGDLDMALRIEICRHKDATAPFPVEGEEDTEVCDCCSLAVP